MHTWASTCCACEGPAAPARTHGCRVSGLPPDRAAACGALDPGGVHGASTIKSRPGIRHLCGSVGGRPGLAALLPGWDSTVLRLVPCISSNMSPARGSSAEPGPWDAGSKVS